MLNIQQDFTQEICYQVNSSDPCYHVHEDDDGQVQNLVVVVIRQMGSEMQCGGPV